MNAELLDGLGWLLPVIVGVPLATAVLLLTWRTLSDRAAALVGAVVATAVAVGAVLAALAAAPFDPAGYGLEVDGSWIPALGVRFHLGLDGISVPLVLLTALLALLVCWHLVRSDAAPARRGLTACVLAVEGGAMGTFTALDLILFFVAFETVLVPMWFVIANWGDDTQPERSTASGATLPGGPEARRDAANRFILFTALGSAVMLLGLLLVALRTGTTDLVELTERSGAGMSTGVQVVAAVLIVLGLAVKAPMWPLHTWLPPAHTIAPTGGSVLLAGVLLKMGTYGLARLALPVLPDGMREIAPVLGALGVAGILWGGLACLAERDLKRLVAFSSVAHMGFVLLGIASMTPQGLQGALFANIAHGLITGVLFLVAGAVKDRYHTTDLVLLGSGLRDRLPRLGWLLAFGAVAGLGLPGLAGFWGEILAVVGSWRGEDALAGLARPLAVLATVGTVIAAAYLLRVLFLLWHGPRLLPGTHATTTEVDATGSEVAVVMPLVLATLALGLLPWLLLDVTGPAVRVLLSGGVLS
ncbi:MAG: NADH-quinone oxidoreductase subunit M [Actinomycetales bacterium]|nr:NADH-quinone oxidoreductase subunit M [Actinomycetales bacterium]